MKIARSATSAAVSMLQGDLFAQGLPGLNAEAGVQRRNLDEHSWIDSSSRWLNGGDELLEQLATELRWTRAERPMYGRMVDEPRLGSQLRTGSAQTPVVIRDMAAALGGRYERSFTSVWVNYYRDGCDSVAWHSDRIGIDVQDAIVAIVSLGGPRKFLLRPKGGGTSLQYVLRSGDLLVMGGACQQHWEHSVPKTAVAPPRMSVTFRRTRQ